MQKWRNPGKERRGIFEKYLGGIRDRSWRFLKRRWGKGAVEGNVKLSELMVVSFTKIRDIGKEPFGVSRW